MPVANGSDIERRTIRALRGRIVPLLVVLYMIAYLDRVNIGFAALTMNAALGITSAQFGLLAGVFFWGYFAFEIPSNILLHRIGARIWIGRILITWGLIAVAAGAVRSLTQLYAARLLLGVAEAGFFPGVILYLTYWFRQRDQARIIALFVTALPITSVLGAPLSGFILDHAHWASVASWRWLLILEGLPAIVCGILTVFLLPSRPADAPFLDEEEKKWLAAEIQREQSEKIAAQSISAASALTHPRVWHLAAVGFAFDVALYAMSFYMPQAIKALSGSSSNTRVGLLVMLPHLAGLGGMILVSRSSDKSLERRFHSAVPIAISGFSLIALGRVDSEAISIALWSLAAMGIYSFFGPFFSMPSEFLTGFSAASGIALINSIASLGGFVGPSIIGAIANGPSGLSRALAVAGVAALISACLLLLLPREH